MNSTHLLRIIFRVLVLSFICGLTLLGGISVRANEFVQLPTGSIPTVTGTPVGAIAFVLPNEQGFANVRSGPSTIGYEIVGVLVVGQQVPALGRTSGGDWIKMAGCYG